MGFSVLPTGTTAAIPCAAWCPREDSNLRTRFRKRLTALPPAPAESQSVAPVHIAAAELLRITRQILHAERDVATIEAERDTLLAGDIAQLHLDAETAAREHRDLLTELATSLREQIADAQRRFELIDSQISAHGK